MTAVTAPPPRTPRAGSLAMPEAELGAACDRAIAALLAQQAPDGHWSYRLETNVCMEAEYLLLGRILGFHDTAREQRVVRRILSEQRSDGGWAVYAGGPADPDCTIEALTALRAVGLAADHPQVAAARRCAEGLGGVAATRIFTRMWLACCGLHPWNKLPELPPELMFLPPRAPLGIGQFGSWARATIVPLLVVTTLRPATANITINRNDLPAGDGSTRRHGPQGVAATTFRGLDKLLKAYRALPHQPGRAAALSRAEEWILNHQEADGAIGGIQPPMAYQCLALHALGYRRGQPALERAWKAFENYFIEDEQHCETQACVSPVWDTALAVLALSDAGLPGDHAALHRAGRWLLDKEVTGTRGDWSWTRPRLVASGWPFEYANQQYPDIDDTAIVLLALQRTEGLPGVEDAAGRGLRWMVGMQSRNGGCAAFDADNVSALVGKIPFCDFGAVTDPPTADVTAHVIEACGAWGMARHPRVQRMVDWLLRQQEKDGPWFGRWGVNYVYGTAAAIPGLVGAGVHRLHPGVQRAVHWLLAVQQEDGGFGEDCASYRNPALRGRGTATPSQTAWGLQGLCSGGEAGSGAAARAARWLVAQQRDDGLWFDERFTGTGFPGDFFIRYHGYAAFFPLAALGRYRRLRPAIGAKKAAGVPVHLGIRSHAGGDAVPKAFPETSPKKMTTTQAPTSTGGAPGLKAN